MDCSQSRIALRLDGSSHAIFGSVWFHNPGAHGNIDPEGLHYVMEGSNTLSFTSTPDQWYHVVDVKTNGVSAGAVETLVLSNITENIGIRAEFALNMVTNAPLAISEKWFAEQGWSNNLETIIVSDTDGDGFATWEEYLVGSITDVIRLCMFLCCKHGK